MEKELGVPRATIRFYEKQEMIHPLRRGNEYRDYSPEDVILLKRIIILRKLGFSIVEVKAILSGKVSLTTAAEAQKKKLQEQVKDLNGADIENGQHGRKQVPYRSVSVSVHRPSPPMYSF